MFIIFVFCSILLLLVGGFTTYWIMMNTHGSPFLSDEEKARKDIKDLLIDPGYIDGSWAPLFIRLAWHSSGTWDPKSNLTGGSSHGTIRLKDEYSRKSNKGLELAISRLEPIKTKYPKLSYADIYVLAGIVALEHMGGPKVPMVFGRIDGQNDVIPPDGRLPDESKKVDHVISVFSRMQFSKQEIVCLLGAHSIGKMHENRSVVDGKWTQETLYFDNSFFKNLFLLKWTPKVLPNGATVFLSEDERFTMLPTDMALLDDPEMKKWVEIYANDNERFKTDFGVVFSKLVTNGTKGKPI